MYNIKSATVTTVKTFSISLGGFLVLFTVSLDKLITVEASSQVMNHTENEPTLQNLHLGQC